MQRKKRKVIDIDLPDRFKSNGKKSSTKDRYIDLPGVIGSCKWLYKILYKYLFAKENNFYFLPIQYL